MKRILYILMAMAVLASCSKHEDPDKLPEAPHPMTISVADGGYTDSNPRTRATENGYITEFTIGDKIGLYVVKPDGSSAHENIELTLTDNGSSTLAWTPPAGTTLYYEGATAKYFAYYPYQQSVNGNLVANADNAAAFFANVVSRWTPATDQSTYAKYTASDLMIGSGAVGKLANAYSLALTMTHAMALVVIETPTTKYALSTDANYTWIAAAAPDTRFYGFTPCFIDGTYRYLVKPTQSGTSDLYGSYTAQNGSTKEYAIAQNSIAAASYVHSKVDGGNRTIIEKTHTLQVGDFYCKDGNGNAYLIPGDITTLSEEQQKACLGIVFYVGNIKGDNYGLLDSKFSNGTHGLIASLKNLRDPDNADKQTMLWTYGGYEDVNTWLNNATWSGGITRPADFTSIKVENKMQGYANTLALQEYNKYVRTTVGDGYGENGNKRVKPIYALANFAQSNPAPASSSGWYWPSVYELKWMCWGQSSRSTAGRELLNNQLKKVSGTEFDSSSWSYWSSTGSSNYSSYAWNVYFYDGSVYGINKDNELSVRPVLAF